MRTLPLHVILRRPRRTRTNPRTAPTMAAGLSVKMNATPLIGISDRSLAADCQRMWMSVRLGEVKTGLLSVDLTLPMCSVCYLLWDSFLLPTCRPLDTGPPFLPSLDRTSDRLQSPYTGIDSFTDSSFSLSISLCNLSGPFFGYHWHKLTIISLLRLSFLLAVAI